MPLTPAWTKRAGRSIPKCLRAATTTRVAVMTRKRTTMKCDLGESRSVAVRRARERYQRWERARERGRGRGRERVERAGRTEALCFDVASLARRRVRVLVGRLGPNARRELLVEAELARARQARVGRDGRAVQRDDGRVLAEAGAATERDAAGRGRGRRAGEGVRGEGEGREDEEGEGAHAGSGGSWRSGGSGRGCQER